MSKFGKSAALTGVLAVGALAVSVATAGVASASTVSGGWFTSSGACNQSGKNITSNPASVYEGWSWNCKYVSSHNPHWHLILSS